MGKTADQIKVLFVKDVILKVRSPFTFVKAILFPSLLVLLGSLAVFFLTDDDLLPRTLQYETSEGESMGPRSAMLYPFDPFPSDCGNVAPEQEASATDWRVEKKASLLGYTNMDCFVDSLSRVGLVPYWRILKNQLREWPLWNPVPLTFGVAPGNDADVGSDPNAYLASPSDASTVGGQFARYMQATYNQNMKFQMGFYKVLDVNCFRNTAINGGKTVTQCTGPSPLECFRDCLANNGGVNDFVTNLRSLSASSDLAVGRRALKEQDVLKRLLHEVGVNGGELHHTFASGVEGAETKALALLADEQKHLERIDDDDREQEARHLEVIGGKDDEGHEVKASTYPHEGEANDKVGEQLIYEFRRLRGESNRAKKLAEWKNANEEKADKMGVSSWKLPRWDAVTEYVDENFHHPIEAVFDGKPPQGHHIFEAREPTARDLAELDREDADEGEVDTEKSVVRRRLAGKDCQAITTPCGCMAARGDGCAWRQEERFPGKGRCRESNRGGARWETSCFECLDQPGCSSEELWVRLGTALPLSKPHVKVFSDEEAMEKMIDKTDYPEEVQVPYYGTQTTGANAGASWADTTPSGTKRTATTQLCAAVVFLDTSSTLAGARGANELKFSLRLNRTSPLGMEYGFDPTNKISQRPSRHW